MSQTQSVRVRSQRTAAAAVERARLTLVRTRPSSAPRAPFAVLVFLILGAGVVGLLMFNTHMQQASFYATKLQARADQLEARSEALDQERAHRRDPQVLATAARHLGMVTPPNPAFVNLQDGSVEGTPVPATAADGTRIIENKKALPGVLHPAPIIKKVLLPVTPAQTTTTTGPASHASSAGAGRNNAQKHTAKPAQGAHR